MSSEDVARRLAAKRFNERLKLSAAFLNNAGIATLVGAFVLPAVQDAGRLSLYQSASIGIAAALHVTAQATLSGLRSED